MTDPGELDELIRGSGLRSTRQRATVLQALNEIGGHRTADELVGELADRGTALPRSTVFNVLDDLVSVGLVLRAELGPGAARYESATAVAPHHHFVCRTCGRIVDVPADSFASGDATGSRSSTTVLDELWRHSGLEVDTVEVILRGRCVDCIAHGRTEGAERPN